MAEIVNLKHRRKAERRRQDQAKAAENRLRFGRPKAEKAKEAAEAARAAKDLEGKKLD